MTTAAFDDPFVFVFVLVFGLEVRLRDDAALRLRDDAVLFRFLALGPFELREVVLRLLDEGVFAWAIAPP